MNKIKVYIDYPVSEDNTFKGLSFPQVLYAYMKTCNDVELVSEDDCFDVVFVFSGGSQYSALRDVKHKIWHRLKVFCNKVCAMTHEKKIDFAGQLQSHSYYKRRIQKFLKKNPKAKIIHRLDDRYRMLCKVYGFDETVEWINRQAHATVFQTEYCKRLYTEGVKTIFGFEKPYAIKNGHLIHNGVDTDIFASEGDRFELDGKVKILHVATTGMPRKGLGRVLEYAYLLKNNPDIQFYLIGRQTEDPVYGGDIKKFKNVRHIDHISDRYKLAKYYRSSDILLYPTINDCSPNVILEAMSCGTPVVAANSGGAPELVIKNDIRGGLLINEQNPVLALKECIANQSYLKKQAIKLVKNYHTKKIMGDNYFNLLKSLF